MKQKKHDEGVWYSREEGRQRKDVCGSTERVSTPTPSLSLATQAIDLHLFPLR